MNSDPRDIFEQSKQTIVDLLFTDLDVAFTFLDTALISSNPETKSRNIGNAAAAWHTVSDKLNTFEIPPDVRNALLNRLTQLRNRLGELGARLSE